MKRTPKTPIEFDYDLWTTEDGKCMVRVKRTGEQCEVSRETFRILRNEEKKLRRSMTGVPVPCCEDVETTLLSLDFVSYEGGEEMSPAWLEDPRDEVSEIVFDITEAEFRKSLTANQLDVYINCMVKGMSQKAYADIKGISPAAVFYACKSIREKAKKYFFADT